MPTDILAPTCQSASFRGSFFLVDFPHVQLSHSLARAHGRLLQPEWKPGVRPGAVAHVSHFCKPCHSISGSSRLEVCPVSLFLLGLFSPGSASPEEIPLWEENRLEPNFYLLSNIWKGSISSTAEDVYCMCYHKLWYVNLHVNTFSVNRNLTTNLKKCEQTTVRNENCTNVCDTR